MLGWIESLFGEMSATTVVIVGSMLHPVVLIVLLIPLFFVRRRGKSAGYLLCFYLFSLYIWMVLRLTILDELPTSLHDIEWIRARSWSREINLIPALLSGDEFDPQSIQVYGNVLLGVPFGFGLPFVSDYARATRRRMILLGLGFAAGIEVAQLLIGLIVYQAPYRVIDIDDVWLVFAGTLVGHVALRGVARIYRAIGWEAGARLPVWDHMHAVLHLLDGGGPRRHPRDVRPQLREEADGRDRKEDAPAAREETDG